MSDEPDVTPATEVVTVTYDAPVGELPAGLVLVDEDDEAEA